MNHRGWSVASLSLSAALLAAALLGRGCLCPEPEPARVLRAVEAWIAARLDRDVERVFALSEPGPILDDIRYYFREERRGPDAFPRFWMPEDLARAGLTREQARDMSPRALFVALASTQPVERLEEEAFWKNFAPDSLCIRADHATVACGAQEIPCRRDGGEWRVRTHLMNGPWSPVRKVPAHLPRGPDLLADVAFTVTAGADGWGTADLAALTERLRVRPAGDAAVLLDAAPDLAFGEVVRILDAVLGAGVIDVRFGAVTDAPFPPGLRVAAGAPPVGEAAAARVIGIRTDR